jgi:hypothetical protein
MYLLLLKEKKIKSNRNPLNNRALVELATVIWKFVYKTVLFVPSLKQHWKYNQRGLHIQVSLLSHTEGIFSIMGKVKRAKINTLCKWETIFAMCYGNYFAI